MSNEFMFATHEDGEGILNIMESDVAKGEIQLLYTRRNNPYDSFKMESSKSVIGIFKNEDKVVGTLAGIPHEMYVNGKKRKVCYVTNMKRLPELDTHINWIDAFYKMYEPLDSEVYFCSIVKENTEVLKMLRKRRKNLPFAEDMESYRTYIISPTASISNPCPNLGFRRATKEDEASIIQFIEKEGSRKNLFPVFSSLEEGSAPKITDFYILFGGGEILALGALWDKRKCKQYVVKGYTGKVAFLRIFNFLISLFGYIKIPKEGSEASFTFLSFFLAKDSNADYYRAFLHNIRSEVKKTHKMFVLGTNESNVKRQILDGMRAITFDTQMCEIDMCDFKNVDKIDFEYSNLEIECALL